MASINFFAEDISFQLDHPRKTSSWIKAAINAESHELGSLNFIFCSDDYLLKMNQEYLDHHTLTDIITFDSRESDDEPLEGDIFISIDRVKENSEKFSVAFEIELHRVLIHGVLHLLGYGDKNPQQKEEMRKREDAYLSLR